MRPCCSAAARITRQLSPAQTSWYNQIHQAGQGRRHRHEVYPLPFHRHLSRSAPASSTSTSSSSSSSPPSPSLLKKAQSSAQSVWTGVLQQRPDLVPIRPQLSPHEPAVASAVQNAQRRKADFGEKEAARIREIHAELRDIEPMMSELSIEQKRLTQAIRDAVSKRARGRGMGKSAAKASENPKRPDADPGMGSTGDEEDIVKELTKKVQAIKPHIKDLAKRVSRLSFESDALRLRAPNETHPNVPVGPESAACVTKVGGNVKLLPIPVQAAFTDVQDKTARGRSIPLAELPLFSDQEPDKSKDHVHLAERYGWIHLQSSRLITGANWPFLSGPMALLEHALVGYAMSMAVNAGFRPTVVPDVVKRDILNRTGFAPREGSGGQVYWVEPDGSRAPVPGDENPDELGLAATAEIPLAGLCAGHMFNMNQLPIQLVAASHAFRAEAGARGLESRGLYRVHQFTKVELFVVCASDEGFSESNAWLERLRQAQEEIIGGLGIPYRVLEMPTEELGASAYRKYDIEAWMPGRGSWGEVSSASNCTDYQAKRLQIRQNDPEGQYKYAQTLNGTALAVPRLIIALLENYGVSSQGSRLQLPVALKSFWLGDADKDVVWLGHADVGAKAEHASGKKSAFQAAMNRVRSAASRSGSDPGSMVVAFLILHELTALLPVVFFFYLFWLLGVGEAITQWLQDAAQTSKPNAAASDANETSGGARGVVGSLQHLLQGYLDEGLQRADRFGRRNGYFGFEKGSKSDGSTTTSAVANTKMAGALANAVAAYVVVKILFPVRIAACVALAGPFARVFINPVKQIAKQWRKTRN